MDRKKIFWAMASLLIAGLSIWTVAALGQNFSLDEFWLFVKESNKLWLIAGAVSMFGFIYFEGVALIRIAESFGYRRKMRQGIVYGAADVYFSAITPSASGGQPASAYFMVRDGMPGTAVTVALMINLIMYTLALFFLGLCCMLFRFNMFMKFSFLSKVLIGIGCLVLIILALTFYFLLRRSEILYRICNGVMGFLEKRHLLRHGQKKRDKLNKAMVEYKQCATKVAGKWKLLLEVFFWNVMQRVAQFGISFMVFMATGQGIRKAAQVWSIQCFVSVGSNCVPIPGAMGVADYLMLDGFTQIVGQEAATNMELLCRSMSFYGCIIDSGVIVLFHNIFHRMRKKKC